MRILGEKNNRKTIFQYVDRVNNCSAVATEHVNNYYIFYTAFIAVTADGPCGASIRQFYVRVRVSSINID